MGKNYAVPSSLSIPYKNIDTEHEGLIEILNAILQALRLKRSDKDHSVQQLLADLREALMIHFRHEEQEMAFLKFPNLAQHRIHHEHCATRLNEIIHDATTGQKAIDRALLDDFFDVIIDDIVRADSGFKSFLYARNILP